MSVLVVVLASCIAVFGFDAPSVAAFEVSASTVTLVMVFVIQHTQSREQAATQRKLDELLRALPEASPSLIMLEEASQEVLLEVESDQREIRSETDSRSRVARG